MADIIILIFRDRLKNSLDKLGRIIITLKRPTLHKPRISKNRHPRRALLRQLIPLIFRHHILLTKITAIIIENLAIERHQLREEEDTHLTVQIGRRVAVDEGALLIYVGVEIEAELDAFLVY